MFLPQQVIKKLIIFELIAKTTSRPERKKSQYFEGNGKKKKRIPTIMRKSQSLTPGKSIIPLTLKAQLTLQKETLLSAEFILLPLFSQVGRPETIFSEPEDLSNCPLTSVRGNKGGLHGVMQQETVPGSKKDEKDNLEGMQKRGETRSPLERMK